MTKYRIRHAAPSDYRVEYFGKEFGQTTWWPVHDGVFCSLEDAETRLNDLIARARFVPTVIKEVEV